MPSSVPDELPSPCPWAASQAACRSDRAELRRPSQRSRPEGLSGCAVWAAYPSITARCRALLRRAATAETEVLAAGRLETVRTLRVRSRSVRMHLGDAVVPGRSRTATSELHARRSDRVRCRELPDPALELQDLTSAAPARRRHSLPLYMHRCPGVFHDPPSKAVVMRTDEEGRTPVIGLEDRGSAIELHPRDWLL